MSNLLDSIPRLPVSDATEKMMDLLTDSFSSLFDFVQKGGKSAMEAITEMLIAVPPIIFIIIVAIIAFFATKKKFGLAIFSIVGLLFIYNQGLWEELMNTITLVIFASIIAVVIGVPFGILMSKSMVAEQIIKPILDFMQTMPGFVYLIPAVAFFGIGVVPGVFASVIFALPPTVRFTNLGIRQVPKELVEAADSYGSTGWQKLIKVELPLAKSTIMAGINQTVLLSLSMVVIASMIGAPGLGREVLSALQRAQVGNGFVAGLSLVIFAIIIDRLTQSLNKKKQ
ncbi:glycine betaine/proline transport system permease protein/glycine betaine/proline transport system substrate-binding protein [Ureibacillus xyleni]|uniref:Glycine betaine/proline transport system permease protein/glycine betaine/proline transport system substrate-binding protein n=1 Tax=Ureibacillus xyleni TaxID=614648 RepID=A0A285TEG7_9BACL|nr:proline/glycine betaine ABC transporter permease [Ureibacillus xyleni]SOC18206.1 glycine betaine/proline transport system permease protein/glycine betaine/proline transport system substrate-binding protein [Ureibacillus xyleni]